MQSGNDHFLSSLGFEKFRRQSARRPPTSVETVELAGLRFVIDREQVTANAVVVRLHQTHHSVGGDRVAASFEHLHARACRQGWLAATMP
jgi:hypothetical protein